MATHRSRVPLLCVIATTVIWALPAVAEACMCAFGSCGSVQAATAIFEATVVGFDRPPGDAVTADTVVRLQDVRMIRGQAPRALVLDRSSCGYEFTVGVRYVIEADGIGTGPEHGLGVPAGVVSASHCGATRPSAKASGLLAFLTATGGARPRVWGTVTAETTSHAQDASRGGGPPVAGAVVALSGPVQRTVAATASGEFQFGGLPDGAYTLTVELPGGRADVRVPDSMSLTLGPASSCVAVDLTAMSTAQVTGRVVDVQGRPVPDVQIELYTPGFDVFDRDFVQRPGGSDATGAFVIEQVPPGRYVVGIGVPRPDQDMPFAPAQSAVNGAAAFMVTPGATVTLPPIVARRLPFVRVPGRYEDPRGGPVSGVAIVVSAVDAPEAGRWRLADTDQAGHFTIGVLLGVRYRIEARSGDRIVARLETVIGDAPIRLTPSAP